MRKLSILLGFQAFFTFAWAKPNYDFQLQDGCRLVVIDKGVRIFPGNICIFLDDGSFISGDDFTVKRFSSKQEVIWSMDIHLHHQMKLTNDKKHILLLASEVNTRDNVPQRDDIAMILDLDGKILHRQPVMAYLKAANVAPLAEKISTPAAAVLKVDTETSHINTISEIPDHKNESKIPWMREGNIVLNGVEQGIFVVSPDLKELIHHFRLSKFSEQHTVHDVQVISSGELLYFNNVVNDPSTKTDYSAIQKYDPVKKVLTLNFSATPKGMFFSQYCGGVQERPNGIFFSHPITGGYLYSYKDKTLAGRFHTGNANAKMLKITQEWKIVDASKFLSYSSQ